MAGFLVAEKSRGRLPALAGELVQALRQVAHHPPQFLDLHAQALEFAFHRARGEVGPFAHSQLLPHLLGLLGQAFRRLVQARRVEVSDGRFEVPQLLQLGSLQGRGRETAAGAGLPRGPHSLRGRPVRPFEHGFHSRHLAFQPGHFRFPARLARRFQLGTSLLEPLLELLGSRPARFLGRAVAALQPIGFRPKLHGFAQDFLGLLVPAPGLQLAGFALQGFGLFPQFLGVGFRAQGGGRPQAEDEEGR